MSVLNPSCVQARELIRSKSPRLHSMWLHFPSSFHRYRNECRLQIQFLLTFHFKIELHLQMNFPHKDKKHEQGHSQHHQMDICHREIHFRMR